MVEVDTGSFHRFLKHVIVQLSNGVGGFVWDNMANCQNTRSCLKIQVCSLSKDVNVCYILGSCIALSDIADCHSAESCAKN